MSGFLNIILNGTISILLVITIVYAVILNRRLRLLQSHQSELAAVLGRLDGALQTASVTVNALRESADTPAEMELPIDEAQSPVRSGRRPEPMTNRTPEVARPAPKIPAAEASPKPAVRKQKPMLRPDTLADRLEMTQLRPADGQPLVVRASAPRPAPEMVRHRAAADELMSVMRSLRKS